jgi:chromosome segregation protein
VFLRSLTLRGFKSFADATELTVEPGITVVVGPNGSGKSNLVDALAWVLGTHSARKVRGQAMTDVIFDGSRGRARAPRARVEISIDNTDGRLAGGLGTSASAGDFSEVRVARTIHADGSGTYEINGEEVRAIDVQELLSDTGLGRELHTIVGQGQLDEILNAKPEERRRYIEEAAGILKHRRRRERAVRKLETVDEHAEKLRTVLRELRRQLRPLERQAQAADRHAALQSELRQVRVRLAAVELDELTRLAATAGRSGAERLDAERAVEERLAALRDAERELEARVDGLGAAVEAASADYFGLVNLGDRLAGARELVERTARHLAEVVEEPLAGRPPEELRERAAALAVELEARRADLEAAEATFAAALAAREAAEAARREHDVAEGERRRQRALAQERRVRWEGEVASLRALVATRQADVERLEQRIAELDERTGALEHDVEVVREGIQRLDVAEVGLAQALDIAETRVAVARERLDDDQRRRRDVDAARAAELARAEALGMVLAGAGDGARALVGAGLEGVLGAVAEHLEVDAEHEAAVAAALGPLGAAVVVTSAEQARRAIAWLRGERAGSALVLAARHSARARSVEPNERENLERADARPLGDLVRARAGSKVGAEVVAALSRALEGVWLVRDWDAAVLLHGREPDLTFVTADGDVASPAGYRAGSVRTEAGADVAATIERADARAAELTAELAELDRAIAAAEQARERAEAGLAEATTRIHESDARLTGEADRLSRLAKDLASLVDQRSAIVVQRDEAAETLGREQERLVGLEAAGPGEDAIVPDEPEAGATVELDRALAVAREGEFEARVARERVADDLARREAEVAALRAEADAIEEALAEASRRREARRAGAVRCEALVALLATAIAASGRAVEAAAAERDRVSEGGTHLKAQLVAARERTKEAAAELDREREQRHASELHRAEVDSRLASLEARLRAELSLTPDEVRSEVPDVEGLELAALEEQADVLVRRIGLLGRVNPLALEEFRALEERHRFLSDQLEDLRRSRRDLEEVIAAVDQRIREVFKAAFDDVAREFELTFATVFPGGKGRLVLVGDDDLLTAGVEVEARPPGKKVKRLSLLSGGERSLTVLAFVFAIFRARPSPFYVLDEVDAALDDVNLQRLLRIVRSFRGHAQVIMVTHQKRSMEIADLLYGVTMGPDAVTKVVAERLRGGDAVRSLEARATDAPTEALVEAERPAAV